jgi:uncharacterized protein with HEPN domain
VSTKIWPNRIRDILGSAYNIQRFTAGMTRDSFLADPKTIHAVAFELTVIGKAVKAISQSVTSQYPEVPWGRMQAVHQVLERNYIRLDGETLWETCQNDIPLWIPVLEKLGDSLE